MIGSELALAANMRFASRAGFSISRPFRASKCFMHHSEQNP
jgi:hypothetical protein